MPVQFKSGAVLLSGGQIALDPDCCCCNVFAQLSWDVQNNALVAIATNLNNTPIQITLTRNGTTIASVTAPNFFQFVTTFAPGDVFVLTAVDGPNCSASATCEIAPSYAVDTTCKFLDPVGVASGSCLTPAEYQSLWKPRGSISVDISGLTGPMAALNGVYNADCGNGSGDEIFWQRSITGFGPREYNQGFAGAGINGAWRWIGYASSRHSDDVTDFDLDPDKSPSFIGGSRIVEMTEQISQPWTYRRLIATCAADCGSPITNAYTPGGNITDVTTTNGVPAESAIIVVTRTGGAV